VLVIATGRRGCLGRPRDWPRRASQAGSKDRRHTQAARLHLNMTGRCVMADTPASVNGKIEKVSIIIFT
jgi:hypothetical protein